jgi:hypothetical protein
MASFPVAAFLHQTPSPGCPIRSRARPPPPYVVTASGRPRHRSSSAPRALIQAKSRAWPSNEAGARPELGAKPPPHCGMPPRRAQHHSATPPWSRTGVPAADFTTEPRPKPTDRRLLHCSSCHAGEGPAFLPISLCVRFPRPPQRRSSSAPWL